MEERLNEGDMCVMNVQVAVPTWFKECMEELDPTGMILGEVVSTLIGEEVSQFNKDYGFGVREHETGWLGAKKGGAT